MPVILIALCLLTVTGSVVTVLFRRKGRSFDGMLFKFLSSFGFMSVAFVGFCYNNTCNPYYFCLVVFGLMFGLAGDILLGLKEIAPKFRTRLIGMGTVAFLVGHVFFLAAFMEVSNYNLSGVHWIPFLITALVGIVSVVLLKVKKFKVDAKMSIILVLYYMLLFCKAMVGTTIYFETKKLAFLIATIGCFFFIVSDTCLAFLYFTPVKSKNKLVTAELSTYYPAQILLALSVAFM